MKFLKKIILTLLVAFVLTKKIHKKAKKETKKNLKHKQAKSHRKQDLSYINYPSSSNNSLGSYIAIDSDNLNTPVTNGMISSGGKIYQTNAPSIPYGTGYSYGAWQKIPTK